MNKKQIDRLICLCKKDLDEISDKEIFELDLLRKKIKNTNLTKKQIEILVTSCWKLSFELVSNDKLKTEDIIKLFLHMGNIKSVDLARLCRKSMERSDRSNIARHFLQNEWFGSFKEPEIQNLLAEHAGLVNTG